MKTTLAKRGDLSEEKDETRESVTSKSGRPSAEETRSGMPLFLRGEAAASRAVAPPVARTILVSGGQSITVYGTFPPAVEAALADGWLSFREMDSLWKSGAHTGGGQKEQHQMMEMLTQRALPEVKGVNNEMAGLSESEKLTWEGTSGQPGIRSLGTLSKEGGVGEVITRFEHYLNTEPMFESYKLAAASAGVHQHVFNLRNYINAVNAEATIAPDDKSMLCRLGYLHYVMRYPNPADRRIVLPSPTPAQINRFWRLWPPKHSNFIQLETMALNIGLPVTPP